MCCFSVSMCYWHMGKICFDGNGTLKTGGVRFLVLCDTFLAPAPLPLWLCAYLESQTSRWPPCDVKLINRGGNTVSKWVQSSGFTSKSCPCRSRAECVMKVRVTAWAQNVLFKAAVVYCALLRDLFTEKLFVCLNGICFKTLVLRHLAEDQFSSSLRA